MSERVFWPRDRIGRDYTNRDCPNAVANQGQFSACLENCVLEVRILG